MATQISEEGKMGFAEALSTDIEGVIASRFTLKSKDIKEGKNPGMRPILILGKAGVGKTSIVQNVAKRLGIGLKLITLTQYESTDLAGIPRVSNRNYSNPDILKNTPEDDANRKVVEFIRPNLLPDTIEANYIMNKHCEITGKKPYEVDIMEFPEEARKKVAGIIFLDELPSACEENRIAAAKLTDSSRCIDSYKIPDRWLVVIAGNGPEDGGSFQDLEGIIINRCLNFRLEPDATVWIEEYAIQHGVWPEIIAFLRMYPELIWDSCTTGDSMYARVFPSPRAWAYASEEVLDFLDNKPADYTLTDRDIKINIAPIIGTSTAARFASFYKHKSAIIPVTDIEEGKAKAAIFDKAREAAYLQSSITAAHLNKRCDEYLAKKEPATFNKIINIFEWMGEFADKNLDAGQTMFKEALRKGGSSSGKFMLAHLMDLTTQCPKFMGFYAEHENMFKFN